jgi:hypothetical protein
MTVLMVLGTIASKQTIGTECTLEKAYQVLDYLAMQHDAMVRFPATNMVMNIRSDALYLSKLNFCSRACSHFFMGSLPINGKPIKLNGAFYTLCSGLRFVVASAAEAKLGALFLNCQEGMILNSPSRTLAIHNQKYQSTATTQQPAELQTTPSNGKDPGPWK